MTEFHRFRGNPHFDAPSLRHAVASTLQPEPFFAGRDRAMIEQSFDDLIGAGVGHPASYEDAYGQALALTVGLLLRLAGANLDAIAAEIARRDVRGLEVVAEALLTRMRAQAQDTAPAASLDPPPDVARIPNVHVPTPDRIEALHLDPPGEGDGDMRPVEPTNPPPTPDELDEGHGILAVGSSPDMNDFLTSSPAIDLSGRPVASSGEQPAVAPGEDNAPLRYLRDLVTAPIEASLRPRARGTGVDSPTRPVTSVPDAGPPPPAPEPRSIPVMDGVTIELSGAAVAMLARPGGRDALRDALRAAIDDTPGD